MKRYQLFAGNYKECKKGADTLNTSIDEIESAELYAENLSKINDWVQVFDTKTFRVIKVHTKNGV